jgi:hypothetical protein
MPQLEGCSHIELPLPDERVGKVRVSYRMTADYSLPLIDCRPSTASLHRCRTKVRY